MILAKATAGSEAGMEPTPEMIEAFAAMDEFFRLLDEAGIVEQRGEGLRPSSEGKRVQFDGMKRTVTDGPFAETKEILAGYSIWRVKDMDEAVEWVKKFPNPLSGDVEIRPLYSPEDFPDA